MFFTQDDYKKIQQWLIKNSVKDTEFNEANIPFNGEETITIVQGNQNKKVFLKDLVSQVFNLGISDFVNITDKYDAPNINLEEAIRLIPSRARKEGQVITFLDTEDHWHIYQFKGALNQWNVLDTWEDLFDWEKLIIDSILPDEEDLTKSEPDANGNSYLSLKDRAYNPEDFSGLGRVILRKNIMEVEDPIYGKVKKNVLYQDMFTQSNTIYEIRYDFDLNGGEITIPEGCVLDFQGGGLKNGGLNINNSIIKIDGKSVISLSKPLVLDNGSIYGNNSLIKAESNYQYQDLIISRNSDIIEGVNIDCNYQPVSAISFKHLNGYYGINNSVNRVNIENIISKKVCDIANVNISEKIIICKSAHGLKDNDLVEIKNVVGGYSNINPSLSVANNIYVVKVIDEYKVKIYNTFVCSDCLAIWDNYTEYQTGGEIYKIGCAFNVSRGDSSSPVRGCHVSNFKIDNCYCGVLVEHDINSIFENGVINNAEYGIYLKWSVRSTTFKNIQTDSQIVGRTGIRDMLFSKVYAYFQKNISIVDIVGINSTYGSAGGETSGCVFDCCDIRATGETHTEPLIKIDANHFSFVDCKIRCSYPNWKFIYAKGLGHKYHRLYFEGGVTEGWNFFDDSNIHPALDVSFIDIFSSQGVTGELILPNSRYSNMRNNTFVTLDGTNFNVSIDTKGLGGTNYYIKRVSGTLDLSNTTGSVVVSCPNIINKGNGNIIVNDGNIDGGNIISTGVTSYTIDRLVKKSNAVLRNETKYIPIHKFSDKLFQGFFVSLKCYEHHNTSIAYEIECRYHFKIRTDTKKYSLFKEYKAVGTPSAVSYETLPEILIAVYFGDNEIEEANNADFPYDLASGEEVKLSITGLGGYMLAEITSLCEGMSVCI